MLEFSKLFPWEGQEYYFRTDAMDFTEVEGHTEHNGSRIHKLLRRIERQVDGNWEVYPSAIWVDGPKVHGPHGLFVAFFVADGEGGMNVLCSPDGVPDGELMLNAEKAGIVTRH